MVAGLHKVSNLKGNLISKRDLEQVLIEYLKTIDVSLPRKIARLMIEQLRTRNFILCDIGGNYYAFVHRTFLEYFCAWSYIWQLEAQAITIEDIKIKVFGQHWQDESWHEVLRLIAGMILDPKNVGEIIEYLMEQDGEDEEFNNLFLAANCLGELKNFTLVQQISNKLKEKIKSLLYTICELQNNHLLKSKIISKIASVWNKELETYSWMKDLITSNKSDEYVRSLAVQELAKGWRDHPDIFPLLKSKAKYDLSFTVKSTAVMELAKGWREHPDTFPLIKEKALSDHDEYVILVAVEELAKGWHGHPDIFPLIKEKALSDHHEHVRSFAVEELAKGWHEHPDTFPLIKEKAQSDDSKYVRSFAVRNLAKGWREHPEVFEILLRCAEKDPFVRSDGNFGTFEPNPRRSALKAIMEYYPNHPKTKNLLEDRSQNDPDEQVRNYAKQVLEKLTKNNT